MSTASRQYHTLPSSACDAAIVLTTIDHLGRVRKGSFYVGMLNGVAFERLAANPPPDVLEQFDEIVADVNKLPLVAAGKRFYILEEGGS